MRKTKIVCTLGPSTDKGDVLRQLIENGMNVARFNFSHGDYDEHRGRFEQLKALRTELGKPIAAMLDTKGPEIRLGTFKNGSEKLVTGQKFTLTSREVEGTNEICSITYKDLPHDVQPGGHIMLDDGLISLRIENVTDTDISCVVENDGTIKTKKGVNVPGVHLSMPYMSQRDKQDITFGAEQGFDIVSASFTRCAADIMEIRHLLDECHSNMKIIAKIENQEGVDNIDEILAVPGIDAVNFGPIDYAVSRQLKIGYSMGEEVHDAFKVLVEKCKAKGLGVLGPVVPPTKENIDKAIADGYNMIILGNDMWHFQKALKELVSDAVEPVRAETT